MFLIFHLSVYIKLGMKHKSILTIVLLCVFASNVMAQINIWQDTKCKHKVEMTPYIAPGNGNAAVVVCPGGSYLWHDMQTEGHDVAKWLQSKGISAFVLKYRTAGFMAFFTHYRWLVRGRQWPDAINDIQQAMKVIRNRADEWGIDKQKVGAMGFSAGGHLVMSAAEFLPRYERPAFVAPIYPVVSMTHKCTHKRSRRAALGEYRNHKKIWRDSLSLELHVPDDCPPVFLVNCKDDPIVNYHNSELLDSALTAHGINHKYTQYKTGGHGFGASTTKGTAEARAWKEEFIKWFEKILKK